MTNIAGPRVVLEPIGKDQEPVLRNLLELYVHDFSEHVPLDIEPNGRFDVPLGDEWWTSDGHFPFFIRWEGKLSGFALVRKGSRGTGASDVMDLAEFFVLRGARGRGIGASAARSLFEAFPGRWEVRVRQTNVAAMKFWSRTLETWVGRPVASEPFSSKGVEWSAFRIGPSRE